MPNETAAITLKARTQTCKVHAQLTSRIRAVTFRVRVDRVGVRQKADAKKYRACSGPWTVYVPLKNMFTRVHTKQHFGHNMH